jgi:hypothetical protein
MMTDRWIINQLLNYCSFLSGNFAIEISYISFHVIVHQPVFPAEAENKLGQA